MLRLPGLLGKSGKKSTSKSVRKCVQNAQNRKNWEGVRSLSVARHPEFGILQGGRLTKVGTEANMYSSPMWQRESMALMENGRRAHRFSVSQRWHEVDDEARKKIEEMAAKAANQAVGDLKYGAPTGGDGTPPVEEATPVVEEEPKEVVVGKAETMEFQAETRKLLNIVTRSLYTEKDVFLRELISNSSDALEKCRHLSLTEDIEDDFLNYEIRITTKTDKNELIIEDFGVGMTQEELQTNLGRIGKSGTGDFLKALETGGGENASNLIGQFGVGFYSVFMAGAKVKVFSKSAKKGSKGYCWESDGLGKYTVAEAEGVTRGTKIVVSLNEESSNFSHEKEIETIIKKYSNFVGFDIQLNGRVVNNIKPLWLTNPKDISEEENKQFYQYIANAYDKPRFTFRYQTDSPLSIRSIFYVGEQHSEKFGMGRMSAGVNLFCRKVLIQPKAEGLLPDFLRFVKGVVDSEDVPLNIGREHLQDSSLVRRLNNIITKRLLKFLHKESVKNTAQYDLFFKEFGPFLKEGICSDHQWRDDLAKLLRMESSKFENGEMTNLEDYISRMPEDQKSIYYLIAPSRDYALSSPYYEGFKTKNVEVLFLYTSVDDFVMTSLKNYDGKPIKSIEAAHDLDTIADLNKDATDSEGKDSAAATQDSEPLSKREEDALCEWMRTNLEERLTSVKTTNRLTSTPAIVVDHESASFRRMMNVVDPTRAPTMPKQQLAINPKHPIIKQLAEQSTANPEFATVIAEQLVDNALIAAGLLDDSRSMLPRLQQIMEKAMRREKGGIQEAEIDEGD